MNYIGLTLIGALYILIGLALITRKNIVLKKEYNSIFFSFVITLPQFANAIASMPEGKGYLLSVILIYSIIVGPFVIWGYSRGRNTYDIMNVNTEIVVSAITNILDDKNIEYEVKEKGIFLSECNNHIYYRKSLDSVSVDFKEIKELPFYKEIVGELKCRIKENKLTVFPTSGLLFIVLGLICIGIEKYFFSNF